MSVPFNALRNGGDDNGHVGGLVQHVICAGGQRVGQDGTVDSAGHHHDRHGLPVAEPAYPRDELHAVHALKAIPHEHGVVVGVTAEVFIRTVAVAVPGYAPVVTGEDLGEHVRDAFVAVRDEDRLHSPSRGVCAIEASHAARAGSPRMTRGQGS